ncbi:MAG: hypothetical protein HRU04_21765 [Oceanospirillaceae bacterium]|nr:hypothetical protein [Oceanospirillaceae bacterium]
MKRSLIILGAVLILQVTGCKSIVKDYSASELNSLDVVLVGTGEARGGRFVDEYDSMIWTCYGGNPRVTVTVNGRKANTKLEFQGRFYREQGEVLDNGTILVTSAFYKYNLNLKVDLKRQQAKMNISKKTTVNSGCQSDWFDLQIAELGS